MSMYGDLFWTNYVPYKNLYVDTFSLMPKNVIVFRNKVSLGIIKLNWIFDMKFSHRETWSACTQ